jgi:hypothetical protein
MSAKTRHIDPKTANLFGALIFFIAFNCLNFSGIAFARIPAHVAFVENTLHVCSAKRFIHQSWATYTDASITWPAKGCKYPAYLMPSIGRFAATGHLCQTNKILVMQNVKSGKKSLAKKSTNARIEAVVTLRAETRAPGIEHYLKLFKLQTPEQLQMRVLFNSLRFIAQHFHVSEHDEGSMIVQEELFEMAQAAQNKKQLPA